ncbi:MAG: hypothetical protein ACRDK8_10100 [Solirubrobacteraceae bacterium]
MNEVNDLEITTLVSRLGRPHQSGGIVIERAAIQAAGADYPAVIDWIMTHSGAPETAVISPKSRGLHGSRVSGGNDTEAKQALRFVIPADALS